MQVNFGIMALWEDYLPDEFEVLHFVGYENKPTQYDFQSLREELATDPEFDLVGKMDNVVLVEAPLHIVDHYKKVIGQCK